MTIGLRGRGLDSSGTGQGSMAGSFQYGNKPSGSIQGGEFLHQMSDY